MYGFRYDLVGLACLGKSSISFRLCRLYRSMAYANVVSLLFWKRDSTSFTEIYGGTGWKSGWIFMVSALSFSTAYPKPVRVFSWASLRVSKPGTVSFLADPCSLRAVLSISEFLPSTVLLSAVFSVKMLKSKTSTLGNFMSKFYFISKL